MNILTLILEKYLYQLEQAGKKVIRFNN